MTPEDAKAIGEGLVNQSVTALKELHKKTQEWIELAPLAAAANPMAWIAVHGMPVSKYIALVMALQTKIESLIRELETIESEKEKSDANQE